MTFNRLKTGQSLHHMPRQTCVIYIRFKLERLLSKISRFEWVVLCTGARLVPGSDCVLGLGLKVSVSAVNKKPRTRN